MRPIRLATAVLLLLTAGCGAQPGDRPGDQPGHPPGSQQGGEPAASAWTRLPDPPLTPREGAVAASVGGRVVFVGGYAGPPCPPTADCTVSEDDNRQDGVTYDPTTDRWDRIAQAPRRVPAEAPSAVVGGTLFVVADGALLAWHSATDTWTESPLPAASTGSVPVADGDRVVLAQATNEHDIRPDEVLDPATGRWSTLPADPLRPSFDRILVSTPAGLVLTAKPLDQDGDPVDPALVHAALLPPGSDTWRTLPAGDQLGGWRWSWTGERLVDPTLGGADGGEVNGYGRVIPYGGRLDPATGTWSTLPDPPAEDTGGWPVEASGGPVAAAGGWLYDDAAGSWTRLQQPEGAPDEPGPGVWAGDTLVVLGGTDSTGPATPAVRSTGAWALRTHPANHLDPTDPPPEHRTPRKSGR